MSDQDQGELRPAYRTLNDPTRMLGLPLAAWGALLVTGGLAYAWLNVSPLPWRLNFSLVVIVLGAPAGLLLLREQGTIGPGRLLAAVIAWRTRPTHVLSPSEERRVTRGGVRLDQPPGDDADFVDAAPELPWASEPDDSDVADVEAQQ